MARIGSSGYVTRHVILMVKIQSKGWWHGRLISIRNFSFIIFAMLYIWSNTLVVKTEHIKLTLVGSGGSRISQRGGATTLNRGAPAFGKIIGKNCMKMKEFRRGGGCMSPWQAHLLRSATGRGYIKCMLLHNIVNSLWLVYKMTVPI